MSERKRATRRKRAEWLVAISPLSIIAGPLLGDRHARRWRGAAWKASPTDEADYRRLKRAK